MSNKDIAIKVENLSKIYRIGLKENMHDSLGGAILDFLKSPLKNYRTYRSLYRFDDFETNGNNFDDETFSDVIWALRGVSFEVGRGEVLGIIGRNGAGKSTLLKILSKITPPTSGFAKIHGRISSLLEVGTGFHQELTGRENVYLNGTILGMTKKEVDRKYDEIVEFSGVEKFINTPVKRYSSGMRVRLAFSVAAHLEPEILIIDEVLSVGDADFQNKCINKMEDVSQQGRTVLFVSHNMSAVTRLCERTILLQEGKVADDGPSDRVVIS
jgi:lipopolysaccharide transport system ATP-binding protein